MKPTGTVIAWVEISPELAAAKTRRILEIIAGAERRIQVQNADQVKRKREKKAMKSGKERSGEIR